jgi:16S rRNA processing protein RimM
MTAVGRVLGTWGNRGALKVLPLTDFPDRLAAKRRLWLWREDIPPRPVTPREGRLTGKGLLLSLAEVGDMNQAELLRGCLLLVEDADLEVLPPGTYYRHQLVGLEVRDQTGETVGRVADVLATGAHDVLVVRKEGREVLVPAVAAFVAGVDREAGVLTIRSVPGLLEAAP